MNAQKDRPMKVMFVDDEEGVRVSWNRYLSAHGFDVTTVEDGAKAISKLRAEPMDVVVSDLKMPDGSLKQVKLLQSSGHQVLDDAAIRIVKLAAPFAPFPDQLRQSTDVLEIIRTWQFRKSASSQGNDDFRTEF